MIKKFIDKLIGAAGGGKKPRFGKRQEIGPQDHGIDPSLVDERALNVVHTLKQSGFQAYIVGGAVRDLLLGLRPKDFDVATDATPEQVKGLFRRAFIIGRRFRIVHVVYGRGREHEVIEVSTFRAYMDSAAAESVTGNERTSKSELAGMKHAVDSAGRVLRDNVWGPQEEDAARRDFTINALYADPDGTLHDYFDGVADLAVGRVRFIGEATDRIREDALRILRFFRFHARFGKGAPDIDSLAACRALASLSAALSGERIRQELFRLLIGPRPGYAARLMSEASVLASVLPQATRLDRLDRLVALGLAPDPLLRLGALLAHGADDAALRLRLSNADARRLVEMCPPRALAADADARARRRALYAYEANRIRDSAALALAETGDKRYRDWIDAADAWRRPALPVGGKDAQQHGIAPGPGLGEALRRVEDAWIASDFTLDREACLKLLAAPPGR
jgi:tRNA nucleotidyltransferase/poly(A) polymerase